MSVCSSAVVESDVEYDYYSVGIVFEYYSKIFIILKDRSTLLR